MKTEDIIIVGGGPAGAYLGYCLAKKGIYATIFDDSHPREKPCGGGISTLAIEKFPILHKIPIGRAESKRLKLISPYDREVLIEGEKESWAISRKHLDKFLLEKALEKGAKVIKKRVKNVKKIQGKWSIKTKNKIFKANILVGADGTMSLVRKKLIGPISPENMGICYGCFARGPVKETVIKFLKKTIGYAWIFPRENHLSIGVGFEIKNSGLAKKEFENFMKKHARDVKPISMWGAVLPFIKNPKFFDIKTTGNDWLVIGDAAGHVDPITGEGITYALWSAQIASEAILRHDISFFEKTWREKYGYNLKVGSKMKKLFFNDTILEISIKIATKSNSYGKILYELINSTQDYCNLEKRVLRELPVILKEMW